MARRTTWIVITLIILFLLIVPGIVSGILVELLWFGSMGYESVFWTSFGTKLTLFAAFGGAFFVLMYINLLLANRLSPAYPNRENVLRIDRYEYYIDFTQNNRIMNYLSLIVAFVIGLFMGSAPFAQWETFLKYFNHLPFNMADPIYSIDVGFYVFSLPFLGTLKGWLFAAFILIFIGALSVYWLKRAVYLRGRGVEVSRAAKVHLSILLAILFALKAWDYRLQMYNLLYAPGGIVFGAGYVDVRIKLPVLWIMLSTSLLFALVSLVNIFRRGIMAPLVGIGALIVIAIVGGGILPGIIQQYVVNPNEITLERPYIINSIEMTRVAYGLNKIEERDFPSSGKLAYQDILNNRDTISSIRLWDSKPLLQTYRQLQEIRLYYDFSQVDMDRYTIDGAYKQVNISPRELVQSQLPPQAQTWINQRLVFTHGYGVTMSPVDSVVGEGLPDLYIKDIPPISSIDLKVERPEIYYGERATGYVFVKTRTQEFDYPKGDANAYTTYEGRGGVPVDSLFKRLLFTWEFKDFNIFFTNSITTQSRIMYNRNIAEIVKTIAPFLLLDGDPYIVLSDGRLFWIQDAYTATDRFPYSQPFNRNLNYIRNSVKVVIDAYHGSADFYVMDETDPIIRVYRKIFPGLFKSFAEMPDGLKDHIRYPRDLFTIQTRMYNTYHMQDPQVFYNKEDLWDIPNQVYADNPVQVEPYYLIMKLPGEQKREFLVLTPLSPSNKDNMIAWLAAKNDLSEYGRLVVFKFPKDKLIYGPMQVEARINQDTLISQQFTLWGQRGSNVIRGDLLVIPIEDSILYVEPIYLQAEGNNLPELKRVVASYENEVVMEETLDGALRSLFLGGASAASAPDRTPTSPQTTSREAERPQSSTLDDLVRSSLEHFQKAQDNLRGGNWTEFGKEMDAVKNALRLLEQNVKSGRR